MTPAQLLILNGLVKTHPDWPTVDTRTLTDWVNALAVSKTHPVLTSGQVFAVVAGNLSEFSALSASDQQLVRDILYIHVNEGIPTAVGAPARTLLVNIFGGGSATITALAALLPYNVSRAEDAGLSARVRDGDVELAVALG